MVQKLAPSRQLQSIVDKTAVWHERVITIIHYYMHVVRRCRNLCATMHIGRSSSQHACMREELEARDFVNSTTSILLRSFAHKSPR
jgi:hypothetical protein